MVDSDSRARPGGPAAPAGPPVVPQEFSRVFLIAVTIAVLSEVLRAAFPPFGHFAETTNALGASAAIIVVCLAGFLAPVARAVAGARGLLLAGVGGLLAVRLGMQALSPTVWLAFAGAAFAMLALTALYETARGLSGTGFAVAVVGGLTADTALRLAFGTWDPAVRGGVLAWLACLILVGAGVTALVRQLRAAAVEAPAIGWRDALGAAALGPFLALQILVLASPAFAASSGWLSLPAAGAVVLGAQALTLAFLSSGLAVASVPGGVCVFGGTLLGIGAAAVTGRYGLTGWVTVVVIVAGQLLSAWLLAVACRVPLRRGGYRGRRGDVPVEPRRADAAGWAWRVDLGAALGGLLTALVLLPYQSHYAAPLPLPNKVLPGAAGIALGLLSAIAAARGGPLPGRSWARALGAGGGALLLLAVPAAYAVTAPAVTRAAAQPGTFRLMTYDIAQAVDGDGRLDPEAVARTIQAQHPDVVALQAVGRGWPLSGTADVGSWLARRLGMRLVWGPAADHQFGNAVLSRLPVRATGTGRLPVGAGPQARGYVWARVDTGGGRTADVWSVDVQHGADRTQTRLAEIVKLLQIWSGAPHTVIAGDLGAHDGGPEATRLTGQGTLREAGGAQTGPDPVVSIFGSDDLGIDDTVAGGPRRFALAATVRVVG
ncbi:endonuclease/exonuclease/phosphatase family protein [Actinomadura sp. DC4]|uniref:endonuclease/exonuclease/phosphatase family protein n=1 Tax=Actinomadura sp. DC4 TaxID=3055069 RepID=UPI0025B0FF9A|nr:endonuclease/exonuclease/phosphatase family protein [Actinomadura sp. DC4]MDN3351063.1 endonuclease/exonuclease/phosphatase [Actinomadura sp. DC4]